MRANLVRALIRTVFTIIVILCVYGCSSGSKMETLYKSIKLMGSDADSKGAQISYEQFNDFPYACFVATMDNGAQGFFVLDRIDEDAEYWVAADNVVIGIDHGRVVKISGLQQVLVATFGNERDPLVSGLNKVQDGHRYSRYIDLMPGYQFGVPVESSFHRKGIEKVNLYGREFNLLKIEERIESPVFEHSVRNLFWVSPENGQVYKSVQHIIPELPPIAITYIKHAPVH